MKKTFITLCFLLAAFTGFSQNSGNFYVSGVLELNGGNTVGKAKLANTTTKTKTPKDFNFYIAPKVGFFFTDRFEANFTIGYSLEKSFDRMDDNQPMWTNVNSFVFGPGISYHFPITDRFSYAPGFNMLFGVGGINSDIDHNTKEKIGSAFSFGMYLDLLSFEFRPTEHIGLIMKAGSFGYDLFQVKNTPTDNGKITSTNNSVSLGLNYNATFEFRYYF